MSRKWIDVKTTNGDYVWLTQSQKKMWDFRFPACSLTRENFGPWLWRYYGANVKILMVFVPLPLILHRVVMHNFINRLNGLQGASLGVFLYILYGKEIILSQNFFIPKLQFLAYHLTGISTYHKYTTESSPPECWGLDQEYLQIWKNWMLIIAVH